MPKSEDKCAVWQFTHTDLDGAGCAVVAGIVFPNCLVTQYVGYHDVDTKISEWLDGMGSLEKNGKLLLLVTDIAPTNPALVERLISLPPDGPVVVRCYDHHKTSVAWLRGLAPWFRGDVDHCGAVLTYQALMAEFAQTLPPEQLVELDAFTHAVDAYDRWLVDHPLRGRGEDLNRLLWALGREEFVRWFVKSPTADFDGELRFLSSVLREKDRREVRSAVNQQLKRKLLVDEKGRKFGILDSGGNPSAIAAQYLQDKPEADYVMLINIGGDKVELRSRKGGVDVSEVAKTYGGGGHHSAAGFILPPDWLNFLRRA